MIEGTFEQFHIDSDPVGDYRFEWGYGETVESLVSTFGMERVRTIDSVSGFLGKTESFGMIRSRFIRYVSRLRVVCWI